MVIFKTRTRLCAMLIATALAAGADIPASATEPEAATDSRPAAVPVADDIPVPLATKDLQAMRARSTIVLNSQQLTAVSSDNVLGDYQAGAITLSDNALSSFNGVGNFLFNTGAQNSLQTGMTLTITIDN